MKFGNKQVSLIKLLLIAIIIISIIIGICIYINLNKEKTSIEDFSTAKEVIEYLESEFISEEKKFSNYTRVINLKFKYLPYNEDNTSNENYYNQMIAMIAKVEKYANFILLDKENNIEVKVDCDKQNSSILNVSINDINNYFAKKNSENEIENFVKLNDVSFNINSLELNSLISNNWLYNEQLFGNKDSFYENYDIYFEEGIQIRVIKNEILSDEENDEFSVEVDSGNKVYNIVFDKRYNKEIISGINTKTSLIDIVNKLGQPQFGSYEEGIIGYKTDKLYIFFNTNNEVSIYRRENPSKETFAKIVSNFIEEKNSVNLIDNLTAIWPDFDTYNSDILIDSKELIYTLYGVKIQFNLSNEHGVILYNNFSGNITEDIKLDDVLSKSKELPNNVYLNSSDLVFESEQQRAFKYLDTQFMKQTDKFIAYVNAVGNTTDLSVKFISKVDEYPNSELSNIINTYEWADDTNFVYSRKGYGIYMYNVVTKEEKTIIEGNDNFDIVKIENNVLTYDDNKRINIDK